MNGLYFDKVMVFLSFIHTHTDRHTQTSAHRREYEISEYHSQMMFCFGYAVV